MNTKTSTLCLLLLSLFKNITAADELPKFETGVNSLAMGHSFFNHVYKTMDTFVDLNKYPDHGFNKVARGGMHGSPQSLWTNEKEKIKSYLKTGNIDLLMMTIHYDTVLDDFAKWIDLARSYNPKTAIFIAIPWSDKGPLKTTKTYEAEIESLDETYFAIVEELRDIYEDTPIYYLNYGHTAAKMRLLFDLGDLEDLQQVCCTTQNSIFRDDVPGHQGIMLRDTAALLWLKFLYGDTSVTLPNYNAKDVDKIIAYAQTKNIGKNDQTLISKTSVFDQAVNNLENSNDSLFSTAANNLEIFLSNLFS